MANPYTSQTASGYNTSPPSDDGSETAANQVTWAKHKEKLADPIKTLAEAINTNVSSAFGLTLGTSFDTKAAGFSVGSGDRGKFFYVTAVATVNLLAAATAGDGFPLVFINASNANVTIDASGAETINGSLTLVLLPGESALMTCNGTSWVALVAEDKTFNRAVKASAQSKANDTTLADDDDLADLTLEASKKYKVTGFLDIGQNEGDFKFKLDFSDAPVAFKVMYMATDTASVFASDMFQNHSTELAITTMTDTASYGIHIIGAFRSNATTGGDVSLQWAQNTSSANNTTVGSTSWIELEKTT